MTQVFISYSRKDIAFVDRLAADLKKAGLDVWYDVSGIAGGDRWRSEIENALRTSQFVLVVLSPDAIASEWVEREFLFSSNLKRKIIPLMYRPCELPLNYVDLNFIDVQGDNYARNFDVLLKALSLDPRAVNVQPGKVKGLSQKSKYQYIAIGGGAIILAVLLATPLIRRMFAPVSQGPTSTLEAAPGSTSGLPPVLSSQTSDPGLIPTEFITATNAAVLSPGALPSDVTDSKGVPMMLVSAGSFTMGSDRGDVDEVPVHNIYIDGFYIDKYEVTNARYKDCVDANTCQQPKDINNYVNSQYADNPVIFVDWNMAKTYCETWRGAKLPTEGQWEKAARGDDGRTYPWGEDIDCSKANYLGCTGNTSGVTTHPDGASPYGIYDMAGNVWEWVADWYSPTYYQISPPENPGGPNEGTLKVVRGGAWNVDTVAVYSSVRNAKDPNISDNDIGFRCVADVPSQ